MKVIVVGTGTIDQAVRDVLIDRGDEVISVGRTCGDRQADVTDIASLRALFSSIGEFDAGFVKAAATELPRGLRINCISPTVLSESTDYHAYFPGFTPVPAHEVAQAYVRAISNPGTGRIIKLHKTNS
jgi:hypothetical protein